MVRISVKKGDMTTHMIRKNKFSQLNDKRFYLPNGIIFLLFGHPALKEIEEFKEKKGGKIEKYFWKEKEKMLKLERECLKKHERF